MILPRRTLLALSLAALSAPIGLRAVTPPQAKAGSSFTGVVGDDMCGVKHSMGGSDADCTRMCVSGGANYDLIIGDKAYTLVTKDKPTLAQLNRLAGKRATVHGSLSGTDLAVTSVAAAK